MVAPVMIFFEWVCSDGFQICGVGFWLVALLVWWFDGVGFWSAWVWWFVFVCVVEENKYGWGRETDTAWVWWFVFVVCARGWGRLRKKNTVEKPKKMESCLVWKKYRLERNNKERLKNNILIKIEFWDVGCIVKWYGISNKVTF